MTQRKPVSNPQNSFYDSEEIGAADLTLEQNYNNGAQSALINNQIGQGVLPGNLIQNVLFDSLLVAGPLDGMNIQAQKQPSDANLGNQLQITLSNSSAAGQKTVKVAIIGLDFNGNLQYDTFTFETNESQWTQKHYVKVLTILFNDFIGNPVQSFNLGGRLTISEAKPFTISRDPIMSSQDVQPNLFFRDFFVASGTLAGLLLAALPLYNIDTLNIQTGILENQVIAAGDVTTQIGEKFLATTNNIQKVSLLLSVQNSAAGQATNLVWSGDLIISVYALQSTVDCITDIIPQLPIEFSPYNIPLAQISYNYNTLQAQGLTLDGTPQPIDFVFSNTPIATGSSITVNNFYVITVKRSGAASTCDILIGTGANQSTNSRVTTFTGNTWVDLPTLDLWYQVYTDAVQVSDGQAYENGQGLIIPKTQSVANVPQDYSLDGITFSGTSNAIYTGVLSSTIQQSGLQQNQITGNDVFSQQQYVPNVELLNVIDLGNLEASSEPLILGTVSDKNIKTVSSTPILASLHAWTFIGNTIEIKLIDDITDPRYDLNVLSLVSYLTTGAFVNAKIVPDLKSTNPNLFYRISSAELRTMIYGDVNGDGIITTADVALAEELVGVNLNSSPPLNSQITTDGYHTTVVNGYTEITAPFVSVSGSLQWQIVNPVNNAVLVSGTDGIITANPNAPDLASFDSPSTLFNSIANIAEMELVIIGSGNAANNGSFQILSVDITSNHVLDISKLYLTPDILEQVFRADILGTFNITTEDGYLIQNYIDKVPPFPTAILPASKIGTQFSVLRLTVDPFTWLDPTDSPPTIPNRTDDYSALTPNRASTLHKTQDIFENDGYIQNFNLLSNPIPFNIIPQFTWEPYLLTTNGNGRFVPTIFTSETGLAVPSCVINGIGITVYGEAPSFDPGRVDVFVPNNLIIGAGGEIVNPDGSNYKVDFEVGTVILEIPDGFYGAQTTIDIFNSFVADAGTGLTRLGFPAMKFSDCTTVSTQALTNGQVSFNVSIQSFSPNIYGTDADGYSGPITDGRMGVDMDWATGQLTLDFTNLFQDSVLRTRNTKVQVSVFLKKGGFNNKTLWVNSDITANLLNLNNLFSGAGVNGYPAAINENYTPATPSNWNGTPPENVQAALDRLAALIDTLGASKP